MPIIYSLVARGPNILAEHATTSGTFHEVTRRLLSKLQQESGARMSYVYDQHVFHYKMDDALIYLCMADQGFGRRLPFAYLDDIQTRWKSMFGDRGRTAPSMGMNSDFSRTLRTQMEFYNTNPAADKVKEVTEQLDEVKNVMSQNIEKVLNRGERIELLVDKTSHLEASSNTFRKRSESLKWAMIMKNVKLIIGGICLLLIVAYFITAIVCRGIIFQGCW
eukprot:TRINITY_DN2205_c0_g1_i1.p2 TRINITY_DN2205_c0_g1~~TRINITY_DN2205_c0_g1_i1.p2  ORF type:complete len:234 (-),score=61.86 TRINITY_DN2205_c0_g1_i1:197-856(-)